MKRRRRCSWRRLGPTACRARSRRRRRGARATRRSLAASISRRRAPPRRLFCTARACTVALAQAIDAYTASLDYVEDARAYANRAACWLRLGHARYVERRVTHGLFHQARPRGAMPSAWRRTVHVASFVSCRPRGRYATARRRWCAGCMGPTGRAHRPQGTGPSATVARSPHPAPQQPSMPPLTCHPSLEFITRTPSGMCARDKSSEFKCRSVELVTPTVTSPLISPILANVSANISARSSAAGSHLAFDQVVSFCRRSHLSTARRPQTRHARRRSTRPLRKRTTGARRLLGIRLPTPHPRNRASARAPRPMPCSTQSGMLTL